jgi:hypothetical protein
MAICILHQLTTQEEWRAVEGFDGYEVSNFGQVRSWRTRHWMGHGRGSVCAHRRTPKLIKPSPMSTGRMAVSLSQGARRHTKRVYELVAKAFIPNPENLPQVNHVDGDHQNDAVSNLEWVTREQNYEHARVNKLYACGERANSKLTTEQVYMIRQLSELKIARRTDIAAYYGINKGLVTRIRKRESWAHLP